MANNEDSTRASTERVNPRSTAIDTRPPGEALDILWQDQADGVAAVRNAIEQLESAALAVADRLREPDSRLIYVGAGTSGVVAGLDGIELPCTFGWPESQLRVYRADSRENTLVISTPGDDQVERAMDDFDVAAITDDDVVIAVSASGNTPYTCRFAAMARECGALVVGIAHNDGSALLNTADHPILLDTGPEVVAGSTRLKAGTAQKVALGMLSTQVMIGLGRVHDGYMVDMVPENDKLRLRATRMVADIADISETEARHALHKSGSHIKTAILIAKGLTPAQARETLSQAGQNLREALILIAEK